MLKRNLTLGLLVAGILLTPVAAQADSINFLNSGRSAAVSIRVGSAAAITVAAGELNWEWVETGVNFFSYCMDATTYLVDPQVVTVRSTTAMTGSVANVGAQASWLFNSFAQTIRASGTNTDAAALQIAIWEVLYDGVGSRNLAGGVFRTTASSTIATQANNYLTQLAGASYLGSSATWLDTNVGQDQITSRVPEPSTLLLMACAGGFMLRRRRAAKA